MKHGEAGIIFSMRAQTLKRSISGLHLMDRLNEGK
jgi:hypothetical protein